MYLQMASLAPSSTNVASDFLAWVPAIAALIALLTSIAAWRNAVNSGRAVEVSRIAATANVLSALLRDFRSEEFREALMRLRSFSRKSTHQGGFAADYAERLRNSSPDAEPLDKARRLLARYCDTLRVFCTKGAIDRQMLAQVFGEPDVRFVVEVLDPIDKAHQAVREYNYDSSTRDFFAGLLRDYWPKPRQA